MKKSATKRLLALLLAGMLLFAMTACNNTTPPDDNPDNQNQTDNNKPDDNDTAKEYRDTIVLRVDREPDSLFGAIASNGWTTHMINMQHVQMLCELQPDETGTALEKVVPAAIKDEYELSDDQLTWTFHLHEGMKFYNGKEITAEDVEATFALAVPFSESKVQIKNHFTSFESVKATGKYDFEIKTAYPCASMMRILCSYGTGIYDKEFLEQYDEATINTSMETMNSSGPYQLKEWKHGEELHLVANPNYKTIPFRGENAPTENLIIKFVPEAMSAMSALEAGEIDIAVAMTAETGESMENNPDFVVSATPNVAMHVVRYGCNDPIMSNVKVRQALLYALDTNALAEATFGKYYKESTGFVGSVCWGYYNEGHIERDIEKCKQLLAEAGYPTGFDTKIVCESKGNNYVTLAQGVAAQLKDVGVNCEIETLENSVFADLQVGCAIENFDMPLFIRNTGGRTREANSVLNPWYVTSTDGTNSNMNYGFYSNETVDELIVKANGTMDDDARLNVYKEVMHILYLEDPPQINICERMDVCIYNNKVENVWANGGGNLDLDILKMAK